MSFPSISIFSERSSLSTVRYAAPNTGAPLTAAGRSGAHPEMRGKAEWKSSVGTEPVAPWCPPIAPELAPFLRARDTSAISSAAT